MQYNLSKKISNKEAIDIAKKLESLGYINQPPNNEYVVWRMKNDLNTVIYYSSGSLVLQGKENLFEILFSDDTNTEMEIKPHLGSDEVGKGDYFGPLVACCAYVNNENISRIMKLGIQDSKRMTDSHILKLYKNELYKEDFEVIVASPSNYNESLKNFKNISYYLAYLHKQAAKNLYTKLLEDSKSPEYIVIDQFSTRKERLEHEFNDMGLKLYQFHKGESDIAVALASVIARAQFLIEFEKMNEAYDFIFPKGATDVVSAGKEFVKKYGIEKLKDVAKISFRTTQKVLSPF